MKYGTFMPELGLGRKGQMKIAATWKLRDNVTLTLPQNVQTFLSLGPDAGQLYRFLPTVKSPPGAVPQSWQSVAVPPAPSPQFPNGAKDLQQLETS